MRRAIRRALDPLLPVERFTTSDRKVVFVIWVAGVIQGFAQSQASVTLPFTRAGLGLSEGEMSLVLGAARLVAFAALPIGWLGDHTGRRKPFLAAMTLIVAGGCVSGLAADAWWFGLSHSVLRTGTAAVSGLAVVILAESVSAPVRAYAISFLGAAISLGSGLALTTLPLAEGGGDAWRIPHLLTAIGLLALPFLFRNVPEPRIYADRLEGGPAERGRRKGGRWRELAAGEWAGRFWVTAAVSLFPSAFGAVGAAFTTERLINQVGIGGGATVLIILAAGTLGAVGFFAGGRLADSWGRKATSIMSLLLALAGGVVFYTVESIPLIVVGALVSAFGTFAVVPSFGSLRAELFPTALRSSAGTAASNFGLAGSALGLILGTYTIDAFGLTETVLILAVGVVVAAGLLLQLPETRGQDLTAISTDRR